MIPRCIEEFNLSEGMFVGGVNESLRVNSLKEKDKHGQPVFYQLKKSILDCKSVIRKAKSQWTDRVNLGEFIAASIARSLLGDNHAPEVFLVYDRMRRRVLIASKYLSGEIVQTLDEYAQSKVVNLEMSLHRVRKKHVSLTRHITDVSRGCIALHSCRHFQSLLPTLANAIAVSMLLGDHDVNPSNMIVVINTPEQAHVARIDLGHAWNNLLTAPKLFGGTALHDNGILDFLNRELVSGIRPKQFNQLGDPSKLWRDYPGIVPSHELAKALAKLAQENTIKLIKFGLDTAKISLLELIQAMYEINDREGVKHIMTSLLAIKSTLDSNIKTTYTAPDYNNADNIIQNVFDTLKTFCFKQHQHLQYVSKLMSLQAKIDDMLLFDDSSDFDPVNAFDKFKQRFTLSDSRIEWIKTTKESPACVGTLEEYIASRSAQLLKEGYLFDHANEAGSDDTQCLKREMQMDL